MFSNISYDAYISKSQGTIWVPFYTLNGGEVVLCVTSGSNTKELTDERMKDLEPIEIDRPHFEEATRYLNLYDSDSFIKKVGTKIVKCGSIFTTVKLFDSKDPDFFYRHRLVEMSPKFGEIGRANTYR